MGASNRDKIDEAIKLISEALMRVERDDIKSAGWRLADALGLLAEVVGGIESGNNLPGFAVPTGRGFVLKKIEVKSDL